MQQIHEAVQALESDIVFWRPSRILLEETEKRQNNLPGKFLRANMHTGNI